MTQSHPDPALGIFSKIVCFGTFILIFAGGLVTSTGSGLSVPDWPLSYGTLFPPMVGGIRFEHTHRMIASTVGFLMLCLAAWVGMKEKRSWIKNMSFAALATVIVQGLLGGLTVLLMLPKHVSISHAVVGQVFFILTLVIAYGLSLERQLRENEKADSLDRSYLKLIIAVPFLVFIQLVLGALMRHTHSGLAIPDFPTMGGTFAPKFDQGMLAAINAWRFDVDLPAVTMSQIVFHVLHRIGALVLLITFSLLVYRTYRSYADFDRVRKTVFLLTSLFLIQILLGVFTVWSQKEALITSLHVVVGAAVLGYSVLLVLRSLPLTFKEARNAVRST